MICLYFTKYGKYANINIATNSDIMKYTMGDVKQIENWEGMIWK